MRPDRTPSGRARRAAPGRPSHRLDPRRRRRSSRCGDYSALAIVLGVRSSAVLALLCALGVACSSGAAADESAGAAAREAPQRVERSSFRPRAVVGGLNAPLHVAGVKGQAGRLYIVEQGGLIRVFERGRLRAAPFLDIRVAGLRGRRARAALGRVPSGVRDEQAVLRQLHRPQRAHERRRVPLERRRVRFRARARRLLFIQQPYANHNGGHVAFGPNGRLYVGMGDGGGGGDPENRAQSLGSRLGKLLSLDVATKGRADRGARPAQSVADLVRPR